MKVSTCLFLAVVLASISGCASNSCSVAKTAESTRQDVFKEVTHFSATAGKALLMIEFPVKNFKARIVDTYIKHSDPPYTVTINIDGQTVILTNEPMLEDLTGDFKKNPEVGTGWKYSFKNALLLEPGKHHVTVAVPLSDVIVDKDLILKAGENLMQLIPVYKASVTRYQDYPKFNHGLNQVVVKLNNQTL